tara:strand:- start:4118 stop:4357 length:240 start_codon:yes stop_codon:yes gene_type:complete
VETAQSEKAAGVIDVEAMIDLVYLQTIESSGLVRLADALAGMFAAMDRGGYDIQTGDFARLLGRDAMPVEAALVAQLGL